MELKKFEADVKDKGARKRKLEEDLATASVGREESSERTNNLAVVKRMRTEAAQVTKENFSRGISHRLLRPKSG